jgi:hypothetical protein
MTQLLPMLQSYETCTAVYVQVLDCTKDHMRLVYGSTYCWASALTILEPWRTCAARLAMSASAYLGSDVKNFCTDFLSASHTVALPFAVTVA